MKRVEIEISDTVYELLRVLDHDVQQHHGVGNTHAVDRVVLRLIDHAQQGVYRPGSWERPWLEQAFGDAWQQDLEPGDPYGRPDCASIFQRPKPGPIDPSEWIEIGHVAVRTPSIAKAARVAAQVTRTSQRGWIEGVEYMDLGIFRERLETQG